MVVHRAGGSWLWLEQLTSPMAGALMPKLRQLNCLRAACIGVAHVEHDGVVRPSPARIYLVLVQLVQLIHLVQLAQLIQLIQLESN